MGRNAFSYDWNENFRNTDSLLIYQAQLLRSILRNNFLYCVPDAEVSLFLMQIYLNVQVLLIVDLILHNLD